MKTLVCSAIGAKCNIFNTFALEWAISLRYLSNYKGEALLLDYGIDDKVRKKLIELDIRLMPCVSRGFDMIGNTRYIDMYNIINMNYFDYHIAFFDIHIWFQDKLDSLFSMIDNKDNGIIFAADTRNIIECGVERGPDDDKERIKIEQQYCKIVHDYGGSINSGFFAAQFKSVIIKLVHIHEMYGNLYEIPIKGTEEFFINMLFDFKIDQGDAYKWNCLPVDRYLRDNIFYTDRSGKEEKVVGVHCFEGRHRFRYLYSELFERHSE